MDTRPAISEPPLVQHIAQQLRNHIEREKSTWSTTSRIPTRHLAIDNLLPIETLEQLYSALKVAPEISLRRQDFREQKTTCTAVDQMPSLVRDITYALQHPSVLAAIETLTGFQQLEADPELYAAGISWMRQGDFLNPHIDNSHDRFRKRYRRINLLFYVNPHFPAQNQGALELWDASVRQALRIEAIPNRLVIMETHRGSWHSVEAVSGQSERICLSSYLFSKESPTPPREYFHVTSFMGRPEQPFRRIYCRVDNLLRQAIARSLNLGRNRDLINAAQSQ